MRKAIVTTTINHPTQALLKYISFSDWDLFVVGDLKTPHHLYVELERDYKNVVYLHPEVQDKEYKELSDAIGWNKIQRRTIGYLHVYKLGYEIIASVDDDNIPYDNWGKEIFINKEVETHHYKTDRIVFDPISATNYSNLWHRGYPIQTLRSRHDNEIKIKKVVPQIQANFWNGDPDIDAFCRMEHGPCCIFDDKYFPMSTNALYTFNQQNTIFSREILKNYLALPFVGRMDDIWPAYYISAMGYEIVFHKATVFQDRNVQNLTKNLTDEYFGYEHTLKMLTEIKKDITQFEKFLPEKALIVWNLYRKCISEMDKQGFPLIEKKIC